jgi:hypothetical protein
MLGRFFAPNLLIVIALMVGCAPSERPVVPGPQVAMETPRLSEAAPRGMIEASDGSPLDLTGHFEGHTTILVFYRGFW